MILNLVKDMERLKNTSGFGIKERHSAVAQLVERLPVKEMVVGSSPTRGANFQFVYTQGWYQRAF